MNARLVDLGGAPLFATGDGFVVDKSVTTFTLDDVSWNRLTDLLNRPARVPVGLEELFSRLDVFEDDAGSAMYSHVN